MSSKVSGSDSPWAWTSDDEVRESNADANELQSSLLKSLTDPPRNRLTKRDLQIPTSDSHAYRTIRDVGLYLADEDSQIGIDYVALVFKFEDFVPDNPKDWVKGPRDLSIHREYGHWKNSWTLPIEVDGQYPKVEFWAKVHGTTRTAGFDINPSTVIFGPKSPHVATLEESTRVLRYIYEGVISQWLVLPDPLERATLSRLDVTVDVDDVLDKQRLLKFVARHPQNSRVKAKVYMTHTGHWETVESRSKSNGGMCVYDKSKQLGSVGRLVRFESQMRTRNLKKYCPDFAHVNNEALWRIFHKHFRNAIDAMSRTQEGVLDGLIGDDKLRLRIIEYAGLKVLELMGYSIELGASRRTAYRRFDRMGVGDILMKYLEGAA